MCMPHQSTKKATQKFVRTRNQPGNRKHQPIDRRALEEGDADFIDARIKKPEIQAPVAKSFWQRLFGQ